MIRHSRDYTRLLLLTFFFTSGPILFFRRLHSGFPGPPRGPLFRESPGLLLLIGFTFLFWYLIELYEFFRWNYNHPGKRREALLLALRLVPFAVTSLVEPMSMILLYPTLFIVLAFYSGVILDTKWAIPAIVVIMGFQILGEFFPQDPMRRQLDYISLVYKSMNTLLLWLIAFFWKRDQYLKADLRRSQQLLRRYAEQVAETVILEERSRLARDIHDSLGHNLTAASIQLSKADAYYQREPENARRAILEAKNCIQEGMKDVREFLGEMGDSRAGSTDLFDEVRKLAGRLPTERFQVELSFSGELNDYNRAVLLAIYRLFQEGITNILKHSQADRVNIAISADRDLARVSIHDNGQGFSIAESPGTGIVGLRNRIELVQGTFRITSNSGEGTTLEAFLPREPSASIGLGKRQ